MLPLRHLQLAALIVLITPFCCDAQQTSLVDQTYSLSPVILHPIVDEDLSNVAAAAHSDTNALFSFERSTDAVSGALVAAYRSYLASPSDQAAYDHTAAALAQARQTLSTNGVAATNILLNELEQLAPGSSNERARSLICWLLADVATPAALATLGDLALLPPPRPARAVREAMPSVEQGVALSQLQRAAARGNDTARAQILRVVSRADRDIVLRKQAIQAYYAVSPSRFHARREITALLPVSERYLAHQTF